MAATVALTLLIALVSGYLGQFLSLGLQQFIERLLHAISYQLLQLPLSDVFLKKPLMLKLKMTGKNFSPGILKLLHIRFVENGFKLWYNYVNVNSICGYDQNCTSCKCPCGHRFRYKLYFPLVCLLCLR